ncbi:MAG: dNTP triphosphohydrolase [Candidatus Obscuribacterales bacterium]|nr:dNTP triphosphohydrolase [Candidatus Obscuribacterales bacterium]
MSAKQFERFTPDKVSDFRTPTQVDRDRLLYARSFARLAEITQVIPADNGYVFHNRLTHSLKVAQLSRRIAEKLLTQSDCKEYGGLDVDAAEAAGLAHDLGHPPFGHIAEEEINDRLIEYGLPEGFEGNAQSFRLVTCLSVSDVNPVEERTAVGLGLNLTRATLNGILKYPWLHNEGPKKNKWGAYKSESPQFNFARKSFEYGMHTQSLEAAIMDLADDITYASHDLIDFYCAGKIPLEKLSAGSKELATFFDEVFTRNKDKEEFKNRAKMEDAFTRILDIFPKSTRFVGTTQQDISLWQALTILISTYVNDIELKKPEKDKPLIGFANPDILSEIAMLKQLTWHYVILNTELATVQFGQRRMISTLFDIFFDAAEKGVSKNFHWKLFPRRFEEPLAGSTNSMERARITADYVSSMTEKEVEDLFSVLKERKQSVAKVGSSGAT